MSKKDTITAFPDLQAIEAEATAWVIKLDGGEVSFQEHAEFRIWRDRSQRHRDALVRACDFWGALDHLRDLEVLVEDHDAQAFNPVVPTFATFVRAVVPLRIIATAVAVTVAIAVIGVMLQHRGAETLELPQLYSTAIGAQETIVLSDGSEILLNTNSRLEVRFSQARRDVRLLQGEALFDVTPDSSRPFSVLARGGAVLAVGTAFSVRLIEEKVEVVVTKGRVELRSFIEGGSTINDKPNDGEGYFRSLANLSAGQNAIFNGEIEEIQTISEEAISRKLAWREGMLAFEGAPLSQVVDDVSRYTEITIEIADPALRDLPVGGFFKIGDVKALFDAMEQSLGVRVLWLSKTRVVIQAPA